MSTVGPITGKMSVAIPGRKETDTMAIMEKQTEVVVFKAADRLIRIEINRSDFAKMLAYSDAPENINHWQAAKLTMEEV